MALIKCEECKNEVSDTAKRCPHCGYKLKKSIVDNNINDFFSTNSLACIFLILAFITSFFKVSFTRDVAILKRQLVNRSFINVMSTISDVLNIIFISVGLIAIILLLLNVLTKNFKLKKILRYIPTFIYTVLATYCTVIVLVDSLNEYDATYYIIFELSWGCFWVLILLYASSILLIIDLIKNRRKK